MKGLVFNIQKYSIHDGPGIRTLVFLKGCPLRCLWCSNPESQNPEMELNYDPAMCTSCHACVSACPTGAIKKGLTAQRGIVIDRQKCNACGKCVAVCPSGALTFYGRWMSAKQVVAEVEKDMPFYRRSGGGVTLSGGEPLLQPDFAGEILAGCKHAGIHTAVETAGAVPWDKVEKVLKYTDMVLYDIKVMDPARHKAFTGISNELILENAVKIAKTGVQMLIRTPVVPCYTDDMQNLIQIAEFAAGLGRIREIHLLPYHSYGAGKYQRLGRRYVLSDVLPPDKKQMEGIKNEIEKYGLKVVIGE